MSTIQAPPVIYPEQDCKVLHDAMKGWGCNKDAIVDLLARRTHQQTQQILQTYSHLYGKDLLSKLKDELRGDLERVVVSHLNPAPKRDARIIHKACTPLFQPVDDEGNPYGDPQMTADTGSIILVLCTLTSAQIEALKDTYASVYGYKMAKLVKNVLLGDIKEVIKKQLKCRRPPENTPVDIGLVQSDVAELYAAGSARHGTDESKFAKILTTRSYLHVRAICDYYYATHNKDFEAVIRHEFSKPAEDAYLAIVQYARNSPAYFATALYNAMIGVGTDDSKLTHIVTSRAEIDMQHIKAMFSQMYGKPLERMIEKDTSGSYRRFLMLLVGA
eukprot:TRINITY_DN7181_c1_g5_i1.p1 TRINITY_DN7181_c1_g5~~TRINITY_DN7181_c1_g5_i1.p1  ORF type:complete len:360 (+),score=42.90 TRINITY_DN7181_c1_g5_i1:90-1082(+)